MLICELYILKWNCEINWDSDDSVCSILISGCRPLKISCMMKWQAFWTAKHKLVIFCLQLPPVTKHSSSPILPDSLTSDPMTVLVVTLLLGAWIAFLLTHKRVSYRFREGFEMNWFQYQCSSKVTLWC